jgi:hypothetical protein
MADFTDLVVPTHQADIESSGAASNPEYSDDFRVVTILSDGRRVVEYDEIQWAIQEPRPNDTLRPWRAKYFFRSKEGLLFFAPKPHAPELLALPDWFPSNS